MAKIEKTVHRTSFDDLLVLIEKEVRASSVSATTEDKSDFTLGDARCSVRVFERYSYLGKNRLTLTVTLFGRDDNILLTAITSGGSQALFFKINTWGEEAFLNKFISQVEAYHP